jgi:hypothetical protein
MSEDISRRKPLRYGERRALVAYWTVWITSQTMLLAAWANAYRIDPWMTQRFSPSMILFWGVRDVHGLIFWVLLFPLPGYMFYSTSRRTTIALLTGTFVYLVTTMLVL